MRDSKALPNSIDPEFRPVCYRCRKAEVMCYCGDLKPFASDPEFVILIHPKETRKAINTGRMAFLALTNATLIVGNDLSEDETLNRILNDETKRCFLLFYSRRAFCTQSSYFGIYNG
ncbi:MAG: DTW domain-containing protein, partial [Cytophagaceae bacterium]